MTSWLNPTLFEPPAGRPWPFAAPNAASDSLQPQAYRLIYADPPWRFRLYDDDSGGAKSPQAHYDCMPIEDIAALPVGDLAAADCLLWLWATAPMLDQQIAVLKGWGFAFCTSGVWVKTTVNGRHAFGPGYVLRNAHEPYLIGTRGKPAIVSHSVRSVIQAQRREHSRKPDAARRDAEALVPRGLRCELFGRQRIAGWHVWGNEVGKFDTHAADAAGAPTGEHP